MKLIYDDTQYDRDEKKDNDDRKLAKFQEKERKQQDKANKNNALKIAEQAAKKEAKRLEDIRDAKIAAFKKQLEDEDNNIKQIVKKQPKKVIKKDDININIKKIVKKKQQIKKDDDDDDIIIPDKKILYNIAKDVRKQSKRKIDVFKEKYPVKFFKSGKQQQGKKVLKRDINTLIDKKGFKFDITKQRKI